VDLRSIKMSWPPVGINLRQARDAAAARQECAAFRNARVLIPYSVFRIIPKELHSQCRFVSDG